ncbi:MAG: hypothetical protein PWP11_3076, partial [Thauera sp.]|nr:hypothetical protein [Thauera sp.]
MNAPTIPNLNTPVDIAPFRARRDRL